MRVYRGKTKEKSWHAFRSIDLQELLLGEFKESGRFFKREERLEKKYIHGWQNGSRMNHSSRT